jgi:hypothetical protein
MRPRFVYETFFTLGQPAAEVQNKLFTAKQQRVPLPLRIKMSFCWMHSRNKCCDDAAEFFGKVREEKEHAENQGLSMT